MSWNAAACLGAMVAAVACRAAVPAARPATAACSAPEGRLPPSPAVAQLAGEYRLRLVATAGRKSGAAVDARLGLRPRVDSLQAPPVPETRDTATRYPLAGWLDLDPAAIGATPTGDLRSVDGSAPGVLVIERHPPAPDSPASIVLRLGAEANRRGVLRFDGGYFALTVRRIGPEGFAGTWSSGSGGETAAGYFCAERS